MTPGMKEATIWSRRKGRPGSSEDLNELSARFNQLEWHGKGWTGRNLTGRANLNTSKSLHWHISYQNFRVDFTTSKMWLLLLCTSRNEKYRKGAQTLQSNTRYFNFHSHVSNYTVTKTTAVLLDWVTKSVTMAHRELAPTNAGLRGCYMFAWWARQPRDGKVKPFSPTN